MSKLEIKYNGENIDGKFIYPFNTKHEPSVKLNGLNDNLYYTLILYDPNSISSTGTYIHWIIINILGNDIKNGSHIVPYVGPHPPENTGIHHYTFKLYKQRIKQNRNFEFMKHDNRDKTLDELLKILDLSESDLVEKLIFTSSFYKGGNKYKRRRSTKRRKTRHIRRNRLKQTRRLI